MANYVAILTLLAIAISLVHGTPVSRREIWSGGNLRQSSHQCFDVPDSVACYCNYSTTALPNAKGHETIEEVMEEFTDFIPLLKANPCSDQIGALLCFYYFPLSLHSANNENCGADNTIVVPCQETCKLAKTDACASFIGLWNVTWESLTHLYCENFPVNGACAPSNSVIKREYGTTSCARTQKKPTESPSEGTTEATAEKPTEVEVSSTEKTIKTDATPTEEPTEESTTKEITEAPTKEAVQCPNKCKIRSNLGGKAFQNNPLYSFAIRGTIVSGNADTSLYEVTVVKAFPLETCIKGGGIRPAVSLTPGSTVTVISCSNISESVGKEVLISGTHTGSQEGDYEFTVGCTRGTGLVAPWKKNGDTSVNAAISKRTLNNC